MTMNSDSASNTIDSYRKRQQRGPVIIWTIAALLVIVGIIILVVVFTGDNKPQISLFATETSTPTLTFTPTVTSSPTATATLTMTPTLTLTPTPSEPFEYIVQEGEYLYSIVEKFNLGDDGVALLYFLNGELLEASDGVVRPGDVIQIPNPDKKLPTATPVPIDLPRGTELEYRVQSGDTIAGIATKFRSTEEEIIDANEIENVNAIQVGQILIIPANLVTPAPTRLPPTSPVETTPTPVANVTGTPAPTKSANTGDTACTYEVNETYVAQIFELVNVERFAKGLDPLTENPTLTTVAQTNAADMACNDFWKTVGSDGATLTERLSAADYTATFAKIQVHAQPPEYSGDGAAAVAAWLEAGDVLLDPQATELGIAYAYSSESSYGGYFTIIVAAPAQ